MSVGCAPWKGERELSSSSAPDVHFSPFRHVPSVPAAELGDVAAWRRAFRRASLRWHPDKVCARFGGRFAPGDAHRIVERIHAVNLALTEERDGAMAQLAAA